MRYLCLFVLAVSSVLFAGCQDGVTSIVGPELQPEFVEVDSANLVIDMESGDPLTTITIDASELETIQFIQWGDPSVSVVRIRYTVSTDSEQLVQGCFAAPGEIAGWLECGPDSTENPLVFQALVEEDLPRDQLLITVEAELLIDTTQKQYLMAELLLTLSQ